MIHIFWKNDSYISGKMTHVFRKNDSYIPGKMTHMFRGITRRLSLGGWYH